MKKTWNHYKHQSLVLLSMISSMEEDLVNRASLRANMMFPYCIRSSCTRKRCIHIISCCITFSCFDDVEREHAGCEDFTEDEFYEPLIQSHHHALFQNLYNSSPIVLKNDIAQKIMKDLIASGRLSLRTTCDLMRYHWLALFTYVPVLESLWRNEQGCYHRIPLFFILKYYGHEWKLKSGEFDSVGVDFIDEDLLTRIFKTLFVWCNVRDINERDQNVRTILLRCLTNMFKELNHPLICMRISKCVTSFTRGSTLPTVFLQILNEIFSSLLSRYDDKKRIDVMARQKKNIESFASCGCKICSNVSDTLRESTEFTYREISITKEPSEYHFQEINRKICAVNPSWCLLRSVPRYRHKIRIHM